MAFLILFAMLATTANDHLLAAVAAPRMDSRAPSLFIINGQIAKKPIPYQVNIKIASDNRHYCGGTLIDHQHVITAAHCVVGQSMQGESNRPLPPFVFRVVLGDLNDAQTGEVRETVMNLASLRVHSKFDFTHYLDDVAVLKLKQKVKFTENIEALALPTSEVPTGTQCQTSGWGSKGYMKPAKRLRYTAIDTMTIEECIDHMNYRIPVTPEELKKIRNKVLCAGKPPRITGGGAGDSGGPLVCSSNKGQVSGITSFTNGEKGIVTVTVYTSVFAYRKWIEEAIVKMEDE